MALGISFSVNLNYYPVIGGGHHYLNATIVVTDYTVGKRLFYYIDGGLIGEFPSLQVFKLPHTCGRTGYIFRVEEREPDGITPIRSALSSPVDICSDQDLFMAQDPITLDCNVSAGINKNIPIQSVPQQSGYTITAYIDGDDTYTPIATAVTNFSGNAIIVLPNAVNGQKYRFTQKGNGFRESFGSNWVLIGGSCQNFKINAEYFCNGNGAIVNFNPVGGSGDYSYSYNNNDQTGYFPLIPFQNLILLENSTYTIHIRDNVTRNKIVFAKFVDCDEDIITTTNLIPTTSTTTTEFIEVVEEVICEEIIDNNTYIDLDLEDCDLTLSYSFIKETWISSHDYFPDYAFRTRNNKLYSFKNKSLYLHNSNERGLFYDNVKFSSYMTPVFNEDFKYFLLNSLSWETDLFKNNKRILNKTWSKISLHNSYQSTIELDLIPYDSFCEIQNSNTKRVKNLWFFNHFRDNVINSQYVSFMERNCNVDNVVTNVEEENCINYKRFLDSFVIVKLEYDNEEDLELCFNKIMFNITVNET